MGKSSHRFLSVALTLLILVATTSWTVGKHYCMGSLMDVSLFDLPDGCCSEISSNGDNFTPIVHNDGRGISSEDKDACCSHEVLSLAGQDDLRVPYKELGLDQQLLLMASAHSHPLLLQTTAERQVPNEHYPIPVLVKNIQLLHEVFLI